MMTQDLQQSLKVISYDGVDNANAAAEKIVADAQQVQAVAPLDVVYTDETIAEACQKALEEEYCAKKRKYEAIAQAAKKATGEKKTHLQFAKALHDDHGIKVATSVLSCAMTMAKRGATIEDMIAAMRAKTDKNADDMRQRRAEEQAADKCYAEAQTADMRQRRAEKQATIKKMQAADDLEPLLGV